LEGAGKGVESLNGKGFDEAGLSGEVMIGSGVTDACTPRDLAEGDAVDAAFCKELEAGFEEGVPEVAVMVGGIFTHNLTHNLTS
jgi:hypothetical protein